MGPTATPALPLPPLAGNPPEGLQTLQIQGKTPASAGPGAGGLFAVLLGQLTIEEPAVRPVAPVTAPAFPAPAPATAVQPLPQTGNLLPQFIEGAASPIEAVPLPQVVQPQIDSSAELTAAVTSDTTDQAQILPLPALQLEVITPNPAPVAVPAGAKPSIEPEVAVSKTPREPASQPIRAPAPAIANTVTEDHPALTTQAQTQTQQAAPPPAAAAATTVTVDGAAPLPTAAPQPGAQSTTQLTQPASHSYQINHPVADTRWGDALGQRLVWMSGNGIGRAEIRLNPPELGPVDVRVTVANDEARVAFNVQHGATREAIEAAMPRLRDMFAQQGIELADASVSQHSSDEQRQAGNSDNDQSGISSGQADPGDSPGGHDSAIPLGDGLIDTYV